MARAHRPRSRSGRVVHLVSGVLAISLAAASCSTAPGADVVAGRGELGRGLGAASRAGAPTAAAAASNGPTAAPIAPGAAPSTTTVALTALPTTVPTPAGADPGPDPGVTSLPAPAANAMTPSGERIVTEQAWTPFATVAEVVLSHPSARVERVAFHQSNHDGAGMLEPLPTAVAPTTMELRDRGTGARTAADIVVDPAVEIRAPVTGTVMRAGTYVLYCQYSDDYVVIEPDAHPGWEVKVLHIDGEVVSAGDRVVAGQSVLAAGPTPLPFESQVDELRTTEGAWPHVHLEVVDPSVPDRPSPGGGC